MSRNMKNALNATYWAERGLKSLIQKYMERGTSSTFRNRLVRARMLASHPFLSIRR